MESAGRKNAVVYQGRAAERIKLQGRAHLALAGDPGQPALDVDLEDLSFSGAGIVSAQDLPAGCRVVLLLHPFHHSPGSIRGHVLKSKPLGNGQFRIGILFDVVDSPTLNCIRHAFYPEDALNDGA